MYKYFISFCCIYKNGKGYGNTLVESDFRITDLKSIDEMQNWINDVEKWIAKQNDSIEGVVVLNFISLN